MRRPESHVIINPASAGGKTGKRSRWIVPILERHLAGPFSLFETTRPLDAADSALNAVRRGCRSIIVVGGDGTVQEVVNGILESGSPESRACEIGILGSGTGHGFVQSLGLPDGLENQCAIACGGTTRSVDVGKVTYRDWAGVERIRYFVNECQLGIGGAVVKRVGKNHKILGGTLAFGIGTLATVFGHRNQQMEILLDETTTRSGPVTGIVVANGPFTGGGMNLAPGAVVDDGYLDLLVLDDLSIPQRLKFFPKIYSGRHTDSPRCSLDRIRTVTVTAREPVLVAADGELLGTTPCAVQVVPKAITVRVSEKKERI